MLLLAIVRRPVLRHYGLQPQEEARKYEPPNFQMNCICNGTGFMTFRCRGFLFFARQSGDRSAVERKAKLGGSVLGMIVGAFVAFVFLGLPLAIIGLFIASTLDRRDARAPEGYTASRQPALASGSATSHEGDRPRRVIYGGYSVGAMLSRTRRANARPCPWSQGLTRQRPRDPSIS